MKKQKVRGFIYNSNILGIFAAFMLSSAILVLAFLYMPAYSNNLNIYFNQTIGKVETQYFKSMINYTMPLIDISYNSGMASVSFAGELRNLPELLYGVNFMKPYTILGAQFISMSHYDSEMRQRYADRSGQEQDRSVPSRPQDTAEHAESSISSEDENIINVPNEDKTLITGSKVSLRNETKLSINVDSLAKEDLKLQFAKKGPSVLIYHTHTTEAYSSIYKFFKKTDSRWSADPKSSVVRVGAELASKMKKKYGMDVIHNGTLHDSPTYSGSYNRSLKTAENILKSYPSIKIVIDLHRDGLDGNNRLRVTKTINGKNAAQLMFVVGTNQSGLNHPNWKENLKLVLNLQTRLNKDYPGLARPINLRTGRFNQHISTGAMLIEVGGDGNTLEEALNSTEYLADAIGGLKNEIMSR